MLAELMIGHDLGVKFEYKYELKKNLTAIILKRILSRNSASTQKANFSLTNFKNRKKGEILFKVSPLTRYAINSAIAAKQHASTTQVAT